jgi:surfactin synthase thioesterase subunit
MSVNVVNRLEAALGISIPVVKLIVGPSLEQFVDDLLPELASFTETVTCLDTTSSLVQTMPSAEIGLPTTLRPPVARTSKTVGNGWLVFHKPNDTAQIRLFCFPFAGGGAAAYRTWVDGLDPAIEVVGIDPPGRASRIHEPPLTTIGDFLHALVPVLLPYLDKPFAFYGHCLGGLTLFETARVLLEDHQLRVEHIIVSGARPPHRGIQLGPFEEAMLADVLTHEKFDPFLPPYQQPDEVFMDILRHFRLDATEEFLQQPELRNLLLPTIRAEFAMASNYQCTVESPWDIPITCFIGLDDSYVTREDAMAWSRFTRSAFTIHMRQGTHFLLVDDRDFILDTINRALNPAYR